MSSSSLYTRAKSLFPGGVNSPVRFYPPYPKFMSRGEGSKLIGEDGNEYIDYCLAFGPMILGHSRKEVVEAIREQAGKATSLGTPGRLEVELGERIRSAIPSMEMIRFTNSGTEATMHAIRLARFFTGRPLILKIEGGFHGSHDYALESVPYTGPIDPSQRTTIEVPYNDANALNAAFQKYGRNIAAFILEPVLGNVGVVAPQPGYLQEARKITEEYGSLLIFDEVITGFRSSYGAYQNIVEVKPDLTTLGKIVGGGLPVGVFGGREDIMENVSPSGKFYQQGTFSGNPLSMAGGIAALDVLKGLDYSLPTSFAKQIAEAARLAFFKAGVEVKVNVSGTMLTVFFNHNDVVDSKTASTSNSELFSKYFNGLLENGIFIAGSQMEASFLSFAHSKGDVGKTIEVIKSVAEKIGN
ncbi:MAG: glutamate-1-semialdehyde 2,1-aminomutase [Candidatus Thermoplasmatota archaeon]|nr:glutamate-1-semialdehyde 2,1-aminomutase [Candidatus Thermoplasmatota archaeon]